MKRIFLALSVLTLSLMFFAGGTESAQKNLPAQKDESLRRGEARATLDPGMFNDPMVKEAYRIAKEIPWVLDSIYCFCKCEESPAFRHKSLLSCYVDNHAAVWDICLGEALRAFELYKKGYPVKKIRDMVEKEYKR